MLSEDPIRDGLNWYTYCMGNPIKYKDPSGLLMETDAKEFGKGSDAYKILDDLGKRWNAAKTQAEKNEIHQTAEIVRINARNKTPIINAQTKITNLLHENAVTGKQVMQTNRESYAFAIQFHLPAGVHPDMKSWTWLGFQAYNGTTFPGDWNFKFQKEWQIPDSHDSITTYNPDTGKYETHDLIADPSMRS